jgi:hypothetical protein
VDVAPAAFPGVTNVATVTNASDLNISNNTHGRSNNVTGTGCSYSVQSGSVNFPVSGGNVTFSIQTDSSCPWIVSGLPSWITAPSANTGMGPGTVTLTAVVDPKNWTGG